MAVMLNSIKQIPGTYPERLTRAGEHLAGLLEENKEPVITPFRFFGLIQHMYANSAGKKLYLRDDTPDQDDYSRLRQNLKSANFVSNDRDYGFRALRVLTVSDEPAENIICLLDPTCYVSHLSAMQRWGLTDRQSKTLMLTRPDRKAALDMLHVQMKKHGADEDNNPYPLRLLTHPERVRRRSVQVYETKTCGAHLKVRGEKVRLSTVGQTFLDMLQRPDMCGGMSHVLNVWREHASTYLDEIVQAVDTAKGNLVKSRAGYILEEYLKLNHPGVEPWKALGQRGSSRLLDPAKGFAPTFSETWMISLNV